MERLWAPWRMKYIVGEKSNRCIFCLGEEDAEDRKELILHRGARGFVMMNRYPYNNGHVMVVPYRHIGHIEHLDDDESLDLMKLVQRSVASLRQVLNPDAFNVGMNLGQVAGAGIADHVHVHIVPRWNGDTNFMPLLAQTKVINEELKETYDKLLETFQD